MLHHEYDALKGYRFLGGAISFYSVSCMSDVIFNPSLLNWSSLILTVAHMYLSKLFAVLHTCDFLFAWIWLECRSVQESKPSAREGVGLKFKDPQADLTIRSSPVKSAGFDLKVQNVHQNATSIDVCDTYYTYAWGNKKLRMRFLMLFAVISTAFLSSAGQATGSRARGQERRSEERGS